MKLFSIITTFFTLGSLLFSKELITPIPLVLEYDTQKAALGKKLFFDTRLSRDNSISCASCHILEDGGDDNLQFSVGIDGQIGNINAPTVYNSVFNLAQFWDGRANDLQEQAHGPIENPIEMGENIQNVVKKLQQDSSMVVKFRQLYPKGITPYSITDAIAQFETALITPNSPFDQYLRGDTKAITEEAKEGYVLFKEYGCISCHNGVNIGGNLFQKVGVVREFKTSSESLGKFDASSDEVDRNYFKVPTLRNISKTAPYFHDGSVYDLNSAVKIMFKIQLGVIAPLEDVEKIVDFLKTLDGEIPPIVKDEQ